MNTFIWEEILYRNNRIVRFGTLSWRMLDKQV